MMKMFAWVSFVIAIIGGAGLVGVGLGTAVMIIAAIAALAIIVIDIAKDHIPNQYAVIGAFVLPSLIVSIDGRFPDWLGDKLEDLWEWAGDHMGDWVGTSTIGLALAAVVISFVVSSRTMPKMGR